MAYDFLVVGAGLTGATLARELVDGGKTCLVVDQRDHLAGNCFTESLSGITVNRYGGHIFHTNDAGIWAFVNRFVPFAPYQHTIKVSYQDRIYSFPINLLTLQQLFGVRTPQEARECLERERVPGPAPNNARDWLLSQIGPRLYETFFEGYTTKQWGRDPVGLPAGIVQRIPLRLTYDDRYFSDRYQGMPEGGYTYLVSRMLAGIPFLLGTPFHQGSPLTQLADQVIYTGPLDAYYDYCYGPLEYRSLRFETEVLPVADYQGTSTINYTEASVAYTRILEHKHFWGEGGQHTVITREYPDPWEPGKEAYYPVGDTANRELFQRYATRARDEGLLFAGRLARYQYLDMHQAVAQARSLARKLLT